MSSDIAVLVFSNIDGFLPHVFDASSGEVAEVLHRLQSSAVSIVLCSSQTRAEVEAAQQALGIAAPFVCESGCAAFVPRGYVPVGVSNVRDVAGYCALEMGRPHGEVAAALKRVASGQRVDVRGFQDMAVEEVARACRMSLLQARLAKLREYGERFRILDPREATRRRLFVALERAGPAMSLWRSVSSGRDGREYRRRRQDDSGPLQSGLRRCNQRRRVPGDSAVLWARSERPECRHEWCGNDPMGCVDRRFCPFTSAAAVGARLGKPRAFWRPKYCHRPMGSTATSA
jgi:hypothetical protein